MTCLKQRWRNVLEVAIILGVNSISTFHISGPSWLIHQKKLLGFRTRAKSKVNQFFWQNWLSGAEIQKVLTESTPWILATSRERCKSLFITGGVKMVNWARTSKVVQQQYRYVESQKEAEWHWRTKILAKRRPATPVRSRPSHPRRPQSISWLLAPSEAAIEHWSSFPSPFFPSFLPPFPVFFGLSRYNWQFACRPRFAPLAAIGAAA